MFSKLIADHSVFQFEPVSLKIPGAFVSISPFRPFDLTVEHADGFTTIAGYFGFDLFKDNEFKIIVEGEMCVYKNYEDIPDRIDHVISFMPDISHDITFTIATTTESTTFFVHRESTRWVDRLYELRRREKARCLLSHE